MRRMLLASAALFGMSLAVPALAQDNTAPPSTSAMPAPAMHHRRHAAASNIVAADTHSRFAHKLPPTGLGPDATPTAYLQAAQDALRHRRGGTAQEAMEQAETRLLDRSVPMGQGGVPAQSPAIQEITQGLDALGHHDWQAAQQQVDAALQHAHMAESETGTGAPAATMPPMTASPPMPSHAAPPPGGGMTPAAPGD